MTKQEAADLYLSGKTFRQIAALAGNTDGCIRRWLKTLGIPSRPRGCFHGSKHPMWNGGRYLTTAGYAYIWMPTHPRANKQGYIFEHIVVAEKKIGRLLLPGELIHHENEIRSDNRPENLHVWTKQQHQQHHMGLNGKPSQRKKRHCVDCGVLVKTRHLVSTRCFPCGIAYRNKRLADARLEVGDGKVTVQ